MTKNYGVFNNTMTHLNYNFTKDSPSFRDKVNKQNPKFAILEFIGTPNNNCPVKF